jgi:hypothetical protein
MRAITTLIARVSSPRQRLNQSDMQKVKTPLNETDGGGVALVYPDAQRQERAAASCR